MRGCMRIANPCPVRGFTLIEILVVVVIFAVLAGAVTLAVGGVGGERQLGRQAEQVRALFGYACEQAELSGRDLGITLDTHGYRFSVAAGNDWIAAQANELRPRQWLAGTAVIVTDGAIETRSPAMTSRARSPIRRTAPPMPRGTITRGSPASACRDRRSK